MANLSNGSIDQIERDPASLIFLCRPGVEWSMKRLVVAVVLGAAVLANAGAATADSGSDQAMANRYLQAAQSGSDDAQFYLAALYSAGVGVPRSDEEAFRWFSRAAAQGHSHAMLILGGLYAIGRGAPKDNIQAYKWAYIVGSASRVEEFRNGARQLMGLLETKMSPADVNAAKSDAGRWRATPSNQPAQAVAPAAVQPAPATSAAQAPTASAAAPQPAAPQPAAPAPQAAKKSDTDDLMNQIPALRKKLGF
jgi:TPR repeat protein